MNRIVREHYPVANLPEDLRQEFEGVETVTVMVEQAADLTGSAAIEDAGRRYRQRVQDLLTHTPGPVGAHRGGVTIEEAVARIRALRDEWDD
jgi:hypothetical protein